MTSPPEPRRFFFVHIQKTGGVSLYVRMWRYFGREAVYPAPSDGSPITVAPQLFPHILLERWKARRDEIKVVTGHFPLCMTELLDADFATFTVLRDPVERTLSYLRHHRDTTPADSELSLEEIYEDPARFRPFIENHMVKMLSLRAEEMTQRDDDRHRPRPAAAPAGEAGAQEDGRVRHPGGPRGLRPEAPTALRLGARADGARQRHQAMTRYPTRSDRGSPRTIELDMELYEYARKLLRRRS